MDKPNKGPSLDGFKADDVADRPRAGESRVKEFLASVAAFLTAVLAVGGGIYELSRGGGSLGGVNVSTAANGVGVAAPASVRPRLPTEAFRASAGTIYRCEVNGKTVYANAPCSSRNIRPVDVFVNEGFQPTDTSTLRARGSVSDEPEVVASTNDVARAERCKWTAEAIRQNEEAARLPQSGQMQDDLTQRKRQLREEKDELGC